MRSLPPLQQQAKTLMNRGLWAEAIPLLEKDVQHYPVDIFSLMYLSHCHYELRDYDQSLDCAKQAGDIDPTDPLPPGLEGDVFCAIGDYARAETRYRKALQLDPNCHLAKKNWRWFQKIMAEMHQNRHET